MKQAFWEVLSDLWSFVVEAVFGHTRQEQPLLKLTGSTQANPSATTTSPSAPTQVATKSGQVLGQQVFVCSEKAFCHAEPRFGFDTRIATFNYGQMLTLIRTREGFSEVQSATVRGWVEASDLAEDPAGVFPHFRSTCHYDAHNPQTVRLRYCLQDEMLGATLALPLQSAEFAFYKLWENRVSVMWGYKRPRTPGAWQTALRGRSGVQIGIEPRTGAIMECSGSGQQAFLAYVDAVHPDSSLVVQSVGRVREGEYREERFTHEEWKEWRPVFISF